MSKPMSEQMQKVAKRYEKAIGKKFGQKTNADHIRSMTDKELAEFIVHEFCAIDDDSIEGTFIKTRFMVWLKQPYKEAK